MDEKNEEKLIKSIIENKNISLRKEEIEYFPKTFEQIEAETVEKNENFLNTTMKFNEVDVEVSKLREDKKIEETIDEIVNEKKIIPDTGDIFIDENNIFENDNIEEEDKKFILDLIDRTDFSMDRNIFPEEDDEKEEINPAIPKWEYKKDIMIEEIMMKKEPLAISEKSKEKIEEKKLIDEKIKVKDEFLSKRKNFKKIKNSFFGKG